METRTSDVTGLVPEKEYRCSYTTVPVGTLRLPIGTGFVRGFKQKGAKTILRGSQPSANLSFYTAGHGFTRVKRRSSLRHRIRSRSVTEAENRRFGERCGNQKPEFPKDAGSVIGSFTQIAMITSGT